MIAMRRLILPLGTSAFLLVGCAGGGGPAQRAEESAQVPRTVQSAPVAKANVEAPAGMVADAPAIQTTQATVQPLARPVKPPVAARPVAIAPPAVPPAPAQSACKVRKNVVEWVYISGGCRNGYAYGFGRARSVDGRRSYSGMFADGHFSGEGEYDWGDGVRYTGRFLNGRRNGPGNLVYPDGRSYSGQFKDNVYDGKGTYVDADSARYVGQFRSGSFHGEGTYTWPNGDVYIGRFKANRLDGVGRFDRTSGDRYEGTLENNEMSGSGTYTWSNGDGYVGHFRNDRMNGEGMYTYADGVKYRGTFKDGRKHGLGTLMTPSGEIRQQWRDGEKVAEELGLRAPD
jgi:hypothetical protein